MTTEIEHKYLIKIDLWQNVLADKSIDIRQGYLLTDPNKTIRIRTMANKGYLTIKGKTIGASRLEFEYEIPIADANELIDNFCSGMIEKTRHIVTHEKKTWEVDEFKKLNTGLFIAEIELSSEDESYSLPIWVGDDITSDWRYANSSLMLKPYTTW